MDPNGFTWKIPKKSWEKNSNPWRDSRWNSSISSGRTYETWPLGAEVFLEIFCSNRQTYFFPLSAFSFQLLVPRWNWQPARWICTILLGRYSLKWCLTRNDRIHFHRGGNRQWLEDSKTQRQFWACFASNVELNPTLVVLRRRDNLWIRQASKSRLYWYYNQPVVWNVTKVFLTAHSINSPGDLNACHAFSHHLDMHCMKICQ